MKKRAVALLLFLAACGDPSPPQVPSTSIAEDAGPRTPDFSTTDEKSWGKYHSKRFLLTIPLPDGHAWKIDDHSQPSLVAVHEPTSSKLTLEMTREDELVNRAKCETRARNMGWIPSPTLTTVADDVITGPELYDTRVWVALDASAPGGAIEGHVYLFGAFLRQCLLVHFTTRVASSKDEAALSARLAIADARVVRAIKLDPPRTTDDAVVPKQK